MIHARDMHLFPLLSARLTGFAFLVLAAGLPMTALQADDGAAERARIEAVTQPTTDFTQAEKYELRPGGATTVFGPFNHDAFSQPSANMSFERRADFTVGNGVFRKIWVSSPSSTTSSDGLGPLFNARACQRCHLKDGRGHPPGSETPGPADTMVLLSSVPPRSAHEQAMLDKFRMSTIIEPTYGAQIQPLAVPGIPAEAKVKVTWRNRPVTLADGTAVTLREPEWSLVDLGYGPLAEGAMISPRVAPPMIGMGLLEAIREDDILALADPEDKDGDGISGHPNRILDQKTGAFAVGRFGWKAGQATVRQQSAGAFSKDMGISSPVFPMAFGDCTDAQADCRSAPHGGDNGGTIEVGSKLFDLVVFYARNLAVPARRNVDDAQVLAGKKLFYDSGCTACHRPKFVTERLADRPEQSFQLIWPYTDLLLHDMGEGLADGRPEGAASGREWRTPPLWGIGLTQEVSGHTNFLHDGRARNLLEAILWHGGEAQAARDKVTNMTKEERDALLAFLNSL